MKLPPFDYLCPNRLGDVHEALGADEDARVLAGGQSLLPMMSLRLARPTLLVDIGRLDLCGITVHDGTLRIGALVRHSTIETDQVIRRHAPLLAEAARYVGHGAIRNRGTLAGSLAHADPAAELPAAAIALGAQVVVAGPNGTRIVDCRELASGYYTTTLEPAEVITELVVPVFSGDRGSAWCEWAARPGDFAEAGVGVAIELGPGREVASARAAACGVAATAVELTAVFENAGAVGAVAATPGLLRSVAGAVQAEVRAAGDDKAELAGLLAARALAAAIRRAAPWN